MMMLAVMIVVKVVMGACCVMVMGLRVCKLACLFAELGLSLSLCVVVCCVVVCVDRIK